MTDENGNIYPFGTIAIRSRPRRVAAWLAAATMGLVAACLAAFPPAPVVRGFDLIPSELDRGELLLAELNCVACHEAVAGVRARLNSRPGPVLDEIARRTNSRYFQRFLEDPWHTKPGTTMPNLLGGLPTRARREMAEALTHFLMSNRKPKATSTGIGINRLALAQGRVLYHRVGCVACHPPFEPAQALFPETANPMDADTSAYVLGVLEETSVPLGDVSEKYNVTRLGDLLQYPLESRPAGRMPDLNLTEAEARAIATYLITLPPKPGKLRTERDWASRAPGEAESRESPFVLDRAKVRVGAGLFASLGCAACHERRVRDNPVCSTLSTPPLGDLDPNAATGCLGEASREADPEFHLSGEQAQALRTILIERRKLAEPLGSDETIGKRLLQLNCHACHSRDGLGGPSPSRFDYFTTVVEADLGDEGRLPPHLTGVGAKLRPDWLGRVLTNRAAVRPYMATRMPQFGSANVASLVEHLEETDRPPPGVFPVPPTEDPEMGRLLTGAGAYACITCHRFGDWPALTVSVMDMTRMAERLMPDWYRLYLLDPVGLRPGTRMPAFWEEGEPAPIAGILEANTERQIGAIWSYLQLGDRAAPPPGLEQ